MAELKTIPNDASVQDFLDQIANEQTRRDCQALLEMMQEVSGQPPKMWGDGIVGFGEYSYRYASGRSGEWFQVGFAPRKQALTLYLMGGLYLPESADESQNLLTRLGKYKTGKGCMYIKKLSDVDLAILRQLVSHSVAKLRSL